jgi:hypothetical protein
MLSVLALPLPKPVNLNPPIGKFAVAGVWPSFDKLCVKALAMSFVSVLNVDELMTVPVTTGWPAGNW